MPQMVLTVWTDQLLFITYRLFAILRNLFDQHLLQPFKIICNREIYIKSQKRTTQDDPLPMPRYAININTIIELLKFVSPGVRQVWQADDAAAGGEIQPLHS